MLLFLGPISKWYYMNLQSKFYTLLYFAVFLSQKYENTAPCHQHYLGAAFSTYLNGKTSKSSTKLYENSLQH